MRYQAKAVHSFCTAARGSNQSKTFNVKISHNDAVIPVTAYPPHSGLPRLKDLAPGYLFIYL